MLNDYHEELGRLNMAVTRMTANANNLALERGDIRPCLNCAVAKAGQKNVPKKRLERSEIPGERFFYRYKFPKDKGI